MWHSRADPVFISDVFSMKMKYYYCYVLMSMSTYLLLFLLSVCSPCPRYLFVIKVLTPLWCRCSTGPSAGRAAVCRRLGSGLLHADDCWLLCSVCECFKNSKLLNQAQYYWMHTSRDSIIYIKMTPHKIIFMMHIQICLLIHTFDRNPQIYEFKTI